VFVFKFCERKYAVVALAVFTLQIRKRSNEDQQNFCRA